MKLVCLMLLAACGLRAAVPVFAQGVPRGARVAKAASTAPRLMVANPFVYAATDSAKAIEIGHAAREDLQDIAGDDYQIVTREQMNDALVQYGYPTDAILGSPLATTLAKNIQARSVVTGALTKGTDGHYVITARVAGVNDLAGTVVTVTQQPTERLSALGHRVAVAVGPAIKALADAKTCMDEQDTKQDKAVKAAEKAIKRVPNHGLAHFCLYQIAKRQKSPVAERLKHLEAAAQGDPLSVAVWRELANEYRAVNDTAKTLMAAKQLLRIAPADQELRQNIFRYFLSSGQPRLALEVAEEGLKVDPENPDMYDLKANACLFLEDYACAVDALETMYATDSTKADTLFFTKIASSAAEGAKPDTTRLLRWARAGVAKYPDNLMLLGYLNRAYLWTGQVDSSLAVTKQLMARDTTVVLPALAAVQALAHADRLTEAAPYIDFVKRYGDATHKNQLAGILIPVASARLQGDSAAGKPRDLAGAVELARQAIDVADSTSDAARYGHLIVGTGLLQQASEIDPETERKKSCDLAKQEQQQLADSKAALIKASESPNLKARTDQYLGFVEKYAPRVKAMLKAYCK